MMPRMKVLAGGDECVCQRILMCAFENESWSTSLLLED